MPLSLQVYADCRTMPNGLVFPGIHCERHVNGSAKFVSYLRFQQRRAGYDCRRVFEQEPAISAPEERIPRTARRALHGASRQGRARCHGTWRCLNLVGDLLSWIKRSRLKLTDVNELVAERYLKHRAGKQCIQPGDRAALKRFLSVLREAGMIAPAALPPISPQDQIFGEFADYLQGKRGFPPTLVTPACATPIGISRPVRS